MRTLIAVFLVSLMACLLLTPIVRALALRYGLVDRPDGRRKVHRLAIPVAGGLALLLSSCLAFVLALVYPDWLRTKIPTDGPYLIGLAIASLLICVVGVLDDYDLLRTRHKFLGQLLAAGILMACGVLVKRIAIFSFNLDLGVFSLPFTALLLLGAMNSLNLLDGMDGLLSSVGLIILCAMAVMAVLGGHWAAALVAAALGGALLGFLRYNFPPASIFLGDSGSMLIGLVVGVLAIECSLKGPATAALVAPLAALTIPILDTTAAILRRKLTGRSLYISDRGHLHHCLLHRGLSVRLVLLWVSLACAVTVAGAVASAALKNELAAIVSTVAVVGILIGIRVFGHAEFVLVRQRLISMVGSLAAIRRQTRPRTTEVHIQGSVPWKDVWGRFTFQASELNLHSICLDVNAPFIHEAYHARWDCRAPRGELSSHWFAEMPLMAGGQVVGRVEVTGRRDDASVSSKIASLTELASYVEKVVTLRAETVAAAAEAAAEAPPRTPVRVELDAASVG